MTIGTALIVAWLPRLRRSGLLAEGKAGFTRAQLLVTLAIIFVCALMVPPAIAVGVDARAEDREGDGGRRAHRRGNRTGDARSGIAEAVDPREDRAGQPRGERVAVLVGPGEAPKVAEGSGDWSSAPFDTLARQLVPAYPSEWRGPYLVPDAGTNPWGNRYIAAFEGSGLCGVGRTQWHHRHATRRPDTGAREGDDIVATIHASGPV